MQHLVVVLVHVHRRTVAAHHLPLLPPLVVRRVVGVHHLELLVDAGEEGVRHAVRPPADVAELVHRDLAASEFRLYPPIVSLFVLEQVVEVQVLAVGLGLLGVAFLLVVARRRRAFRVHRRVVDGAFLAHKRVGGVQTRPLAALDGVQLPPLALEDVLALLLELHHIHRVHIVVHQLAALVRHGRQHGVHLLAAPAQQVGQHDVQDRPWLAVRVEEVVRPELVFVVLEHSGAEVARVERVARRALVGVVELDAQALARPRLVGVAILVQQLVDVALVDGPVAVEVDFFVELFEGLLYFVHQAHLGVGEPRGRVFAEEAGLRLRDVVAHLQQRPLVVDFPEQEVQCGHAAGLVHVDLPAVEDLVDDARKADACHPLEQRVRVAGRVAAELVHVVRPFGPSRPQELVEESHQDSPSEEHHLEETVNDPAPDELVEARTVEHIDGAREHPHRREEEPRPRDEHHHIAGPDAPRPKRRRQNLGVSADRRVRHPVAPQQELNVVTNLLGAADVARALVDEERRGDVAAQEHQQLPAVGFEDLEFDGEFGYVDFFGLGFALLLENRNHLFDPLPQQVELVHPQPIVLVARRDLLLNVLVQGDEVRVDLVVVGLARGEVDVRAQGVVCFVRFPPVFYFWLLLPQEVFLDTRRCGERFRE